MNTGQGRVTDVDGVSLYAEDHGSGTPVLLIHDWPDSARLARLTTSPTAHPDSAFRPSPWPPHTGQVPGQAARPLMRTQNSCPGGLVRLGGLRHGTIVGTSITTLTRLYAMLLPGGRRHDAKNLSVALGASLTPNQP